MALCGGTFPRRRLPRLRGKARATAIRARTRQRQPPPTGSGRTLTTAAWAADGGQDQPPDPARDAQPGRSRILPQIANPAPASASKEDTA